MHDHDHAEVFWIISGEATHTINGTFQRLKPGSLVLIRPEDRHSFRGVNRGFVSANVGFPRVIQQTVINRLAGTSAKLWGDEPVPNVHALTDTQMSTLEVALSDLARGRDEPWEIERFLLNLAHLLDSGGGVKKASQPWPDWLQQACVKIQEPQHFIEGTQGFARLAGRSPGYLARELRRLMGRSPTDLLNEARMRHAAHLLLTTELTVLAVALDCGFQSLGHFYRVFETAYGLTPRAFRIRQSDGGED